MNPVALASAAQKYTFHPMAVPKICGVIDVGSIFTRLDLESVYHNSNEEFRALNMVNFLFTRRLNRPVVTNKLYLGCRSNSIAWRFITEFNRGVRFQQEEIRVGFDRIQVISGDNSEIRGDKYGGSSDGYLTLHNVDRGRVKKVLILMSDTGGGHRASAEAIKSAFMEEFGDEYQVSITDLWADHTPWPFNQLPKSYNFLVKHEALWKMTYYGTTPRVVHCANFAASSVIISEKVTKGLMQFQPDIIISVHPLMQHVPLQILRSKGLLRKIVFTTVVTDLCTCHPTWFHNLVSRCYCPTQNLANRALKAGLKESQIRVYGVPVRPSFVKPVRPKCELRKELGMDNVLPAVLLMGGGEGMGPIEVTAEALEKSLYDDASGEARGQILVICGRNKKLMNKLSSVKWRIPVQVKAFVSKMDECMGACDCIITKAGPGTISEAMICGLPIILNDFIAGQESGNVPYVVENGCGKFLRSPEEIARIVADWFGPNSGEMEKMSQNSLKMGRPEAVVDIVHDIHELLQERRSLLVPHYA